MRVVWVIIIILVLVIWSRPKTEIAMVAHVIDGDTLELTDGRTVRLLQINAPERDQCGYDEATRRLRQLAQGRIELESDDLFGDQDEYGRLLRYVRDDDRVVNVVLQQEGLVDTYFYEGHHGKYAYLMNGTGSCAS